MSTTDDRDQVLSAAHPGELANRLLKVHEHAATFSDPWSEVAHVVWAALAEKDAELERLRDRQRDVPIFHCQTHMCGACSGCKAAGVRDENTALRAVVRAVATLLNDVRCLDRDDAGNNHCEQRAVAVPWGTLYRKDQVGPKCAEHLRLRHPDATLAPASWLSGPLPILYLDDLHLLMDRLAPSGDPCPHISLSGADVRDLEDPEKLWRCDGCGATGTAEALR
jgi:hypothetical protein